MNKRTLLGAVCAASSTLTTDTPSTCVVRFAVSLPFLKLPLGTPMPSMFSLCVPATGILNSAEHSMNDRVVGTFTRQISFVEPSGQ